MRKIEKILDWATLFVFILAATTSLIFGNYQLALWQIMTLMWFGLAWARKIRIEEILKEISEYFDNDESNKNID